MCVLPHLYAYLCAFIGNIRYCNVPYSRRSQKRHVVIRIHVELQCSPEDVINLLEMFAELFYSLSIEQH